MTKTVHCIRHGQSTFNAHWEQGGGVDPLHFDAVLSDLGQQQVKAAAAAVRAVPYELVVTSPLTRAIQTTLGLFADHPAAPKIQVECLHRERLDSSCDVGRSPALLRSEFPALTFDHLEEVWWHRDGDPDERGIVVEPDAGADRPRAVFPQLAFGAPGARHRGGGPRHFLLSFDRAAAAELRNCGAGPLIGDGGSSPACPKRGCARAGSPCACQNPMLVHPRLTG